ncbi:MBL fold metallo-hydrolase [Candidatus Dependentiae bacterium]|nr:MBL fold metallo-hydrolase [Candidatus Dependentiae bacterium]
MKISKTNTLFVMQNKNTNIIKFLSLIFLFLFASYYFYFFENNKIHSVSSIPTQLWQPGKLLVAFIDVGQGDAAIIITPNKKTIVLDAGASNDNNKKSNGQKIIDYLKQYDISSIDQLIISHPHADHIGGMIPLLKKLAVKSLIDTGFKTTNSQYMQILKFVKEKNIGYTIPEKNEILTFDDNVTAKVLNVAHIVPENILYANNSSIVLKMQFFNISFLLTGDMENGVEKIILWDSPDLKSDVLKIAHHGSRSSTSEEFLHEVMPKYAVIMCGKNNHFGHPHQPTLDKLKKISTNLYRSDINGTIEFLTDGHELQVTLQKESDPEKQYKYFKFEK